MQFLISPVEYSDKMFAYLLMQPFHINPADFYTLKQKVKNNGYSLIENIKNLLKEPAPNDKLKKQIYALLKSDSNSAIENIKQLLNNTDEENKKRDLDNICFAKKFILDALVKANVLKNDTHNYVVGFTDTFQYEKKNAFIDFLKSIPLIKAEIEYKDMIRYVDDVLKFKGDK